MKVVLLLGFLLACAYAQTAQNWDLTEVAQAEWSKTAVGDRKTVNQGYTARYTEQGKLLKLSLNVHKEKQVRVTDSDRLLFGMEGSSAVQEETMANMTLSRKDTVALCKRALGPNWQSMVALPEADLTYVEVLRLAASLNEFNVLAEQHHSGNVKRNSLHTRRNSHQGGSQWDCVCHGTDHRFPSAPHGGGPFWGVRVLQKHTSYTSPGHTPYGPRDCLLCDHDDIVGDDTGAGFEYDCRYCCFGECVTQTEGQTRRDGDNWPVCDAEFRFDDLRSEDAALDDSFNYYLINDVGTCRVPRVFKCEEEVPRYCETCQGFIDQLMGDSEVSFATELSECRYCDLVVGANPHLCHNCSYSLGVIEEYARNVGFRNGEVTDCDCDNAMFHIAQGDYGFGEAGDHEIHHEAADGDDHQQREGVDYIYQTDYDYDFDYNQDFDYDYDYDFRSGDGDDNHYKGYHDPGAYGYNYESHDYDFDFRAPTYHEDARPGSYDYDFDYRPSDYTVDYDYDFDYDFRAPTYHEDSRPNPLDYDYRLYDYDYEGDGHHEGRGYRRSAPQKRTHH